MPARDGTELEFLPRGDERWFGHRVAVAAATPSTTRRAMVRSVFRFAPAWAEKFEEEMVEGDHYGKDARWEEEGEFGDRVAILGRVTYK